MEAMKIIPRFETLTEKKLVGKRMEMSFSKNTTADLWKSFMQSRKEILNATSSDLYSLQIYEPGFFKNFDPNKLFEKWACQEVPDFSAVSEGMEKFVLEEGLYAVFLYKGDAKNAASTFQYILGTWLPSTNYILDARPHFEILGSKYKKDDPESEEEIWIPIKSK